MAFKSLLLDVNGVVLRDPDLFRWVRQNHVAYVKAKVPHSKNPRETERLVRIAYGHTARGLQKVYGVDTSDFAEKVYDKKLMDRLTETLYSTEFQQDAKIIHEIASGYEWKVTLMSNAPGVWVSKVAEAISDHVYTCYNKDDMKWPVHHVHVFVDDDVKNMRYLPNITPVLFTQNKNPNAWYAQVNSFEDLAMLIRSIDMWIEHNHLRTSL